jgi:hypothetical protein
MSRMQKFAWFNLAVIALTLLVVFSLVPFLGYRAMGGLGFLGLMGVGPLFFRKKPGQVVTDERDHLIQWRSWIFAYAVFWVVLVLVAVGLSAAVYGEDGAVPVSVVRISVAWAFMLVYALASIAVLVQYVGGSSDAE